MDIRSRRESSRKDCSTVGNPANPRRPGKAGKPGWLPGQLVRLCESQLLGERRPISDVHGRVRLRRHARRSVSSKEASVFRRTICAMTAWAALSGTANAQPPDADPIAERKGPGEPETLPAREPAAPAIPQPATPRQPRFGRPKPIIASVTRESEPVAAAKPRPVAGPTQASGSEIDSPSEPVPPAPIETPPAVAARRFGDPLAAPPGRAWTRVEWLLWAASGQHVPPAITTSPFGTPANFAGIVANPGTEVLFPTDRVNGEFRAASA